MNRMASQITSLTIFYLTVYSGANQRKHQSSASLAFVRGIHRWPVNSPHKWPVTWKMFYDVIMIKYNFSWFAFKVHWQMGFKWLIIQIGYKHQSSPHLKNHIRIKEIDVEWFVFLLNHTIFPRNYTYCFRSAESCCVLVLVDFTMS